MILQISYNENKDYFKQSKTKNAFDGPSGRQKDLSVGVYLEIVPNLGVFIDILRDLSNAWKLNLVVKSSCMLKYLC